MDQVVVNHRGAFTNIVARWPGSVHDSRMFAESVLGQHVNNGGIAGNWLLGDSGYDLRQNMMIPFKVAELVSPAHIMYDLKISVPIYSFLFILVQFSFPSLKVQQKALQNQSASGDGYRDVEKQVYHFAETIPPSA